MKKTQKGSSTATVVGVVASVAALGAAAYVLFGKDGKKNRKAISGWAIKMKGEIIEKFEDAKEITEPIYNKIVDEVSAKYMKAKNVDKAELEKAVSGIKKHWKAMVKDMPKKKK